MLQKKKQQYFERKERKNKKKLRFCHLLNSVKRSVVFFEPKKFWDKNRKQILLVSFLLPLFLLQTSQCFCSKKKPKQFASWNGWNPFFRQMRKQKEKKTSYLFLKPTFCGFFLKEKWALSCCCCWQRKLRESKPFCWVFFWAFANNFSLPVLLMPKKLLVSSQDNGCQNRFV